jgi:hypothetical protein
MQPERELVAGFVEGIGHRWFPYLGGWSVPERQRNSATSSIESPTTISKRRISAMASSCSEMDLWDLRNSLACPHRPPERARAECSGRGVSAQSGHFCNTLFPFCSQSRDDLATAAVFAEDHIQIVAIWYNLLYLTKNYCEIRPSRGPGEMKQLLPGQRSPRGTEEAKYNEKTICCVLEGCLCWGDR